LFSLGVAAVYLALIALSPWPPLPTLGHLAAYNNCASSRLVGLAPAFRGEPGCWKHLDADNDGKACEPWPRRQYE
jgi:hypothetical protein